MTEASLGKGLKIFKSEFNLPAAIMAVMPLKQLAASHKPNAKDVAERLLKTTAIVMQLGAANSTYERIPRREMTDRLIISRLRDFDLTFFYHEKIDSSIPLAKIRICFLAISTPAWIF
jgi:hypothetical protein